MDIEVYGKSEKGLHLEIQDAFLINEKKRLFAVADGVTISKGNSAKASKTAIALLKEGDLKNVLNIHKKIIAMEDTGTTTITVVQIKETAKVVHVGDSSLFLVRDSVEKITEDDSTPGSQLLTQVVGKGEITPHEYTIKLQDGDVLVLATDGVSRYVTDQEIQEAVTNLPQAPDFLITKAREKKKLYEDDKTVVVIKVNYISS